MSLPKRKKLTYSIRYDPQNLNRRVVVKLSPARRTVELKREAIDILRSKQGTTVGCLNANCALRSQGAFPHPVYLAVFTKSRAYFVDKLDSNGQPKHAVWYRHNAGGSVDLNDTIKDRFELLSRLDLQKPILLLPPQKRTGHVYSANPNPKKNSPRGAVVYRGATERAKKAGLLVLPSGFSRTYEKR